MASRTSQGTFSQYIEIELVQDSVNCYSRFVPAAKTILLFLWCDSLVKSKQSSIKAARLSHFFNYVWGSNNHEHCQGAVILS